jgi:short-subunit dehydrogenase
MAPTDTGPPGDKANKAYIVTGPTAGIGRQTALDLARHGIVVLAGRDRSRLDSVRQTT